jgi:hypothetical protein
VAGRSERAGGERAPYQDFAFVVRANKQALKRIAALPFVRWAGHLPHMARVAPSVMLRADRGPTDTSSTLPRTRVIPGAYTVEFFGSGDLTAGLPTVKKLGFKILGKDAKAKLLIIEASGAGGTRRKRIEGLAAVHGVRSIRERSLKRTSNDVAAGIMGAEMAIGSLPWSEREGRAYREL